MIDLDTIYTRAKDINLKELFPSGALYVAGEWRMGSGSPITSIFPADGSENVTLKGASEDDTLYAIERAKSAAFDPAWREMLPHLRARFLHRIADGIDANLTRIAIVQSRDTGKTLAETGALAMSAAGTFRYFAAVCETANDQITTQRGSSTTFSIHDPLGVVVAITPWNSPIASDAQKLAPALAAGNSVLLKPSSWSPLTALVLAEIIEASGLPKGLVSVLPGAGSVVGSVLTDHPDVARVAFTGGTETGRILAEAAARKFMPVSLELGGKSPVAVFSDADMDRAIAGVLFGIFSSTGQSCIAGSRLFVESSILSDFLLRLKTATEALQIGHPFDPRTQIAPMVRHTHRDAVAHDVAEAVNAGAAVLTGGKVPKIDGLDSGAFYAPTILTGVSNSDAICRKEVFGPVLAILPFEDEADLIAQSNASDYGLSAGIWTSDFEKAWRVARRIRAGTVWINTYKQFSVSTPFGADGASGIGREKGIEGLRAWQTQKGIYIDLTGGTIPWAARQ